MPSFKVYEDKENSGDMKKRNKGKEESRKVGLREVNLNCMVEKKRKKEGDEIAKEPKEKTKMCRRRVKSIKKDALSPVRSTRYRHDVYNYLKSIERRHWPKPGLMLKQPHLTAKMRSVLVDWLVEVALEFELGDEVMWSAVYYIDRFLSKFSVVQSKYQLVGITSLFLASKYEAVFYPPLREYVYVTDSTYTEEQVLTMEALLLRGLEYELGYPSPIVFLRHVGYESRLDKPTLDLASYLLELVILEGDKYFVFPPSLLACSSIALARHCLGTSAWPQRLVSATGYSLSDLVPVLNYLNLTHLSAPSLTLRSIFDKYSLQKFGSVTSVPHIDLSC